MTSSIEKPLIVPLMVEAFVVNDHVRHAGTFVRGQLDYGGLNDGDNAQTLNLDRRFYSYDADAPAYYNGVYLKWRLPRALRRATHHGVSGTTHFASVPNRWLVVRHAGTDLLQRTAEAWLIESDTQSTDPGHPSDASQVGSVYAVDTVSNGIPTSRAVYLGKKAPLGSIAWSEPGTSLPLTAHGPGNPLFSLYQPHCNNILSMFDPLAAAPDQLLSYLVVGWYSLPDNDPLGSAGADLLKVLEPLGWTLPPSTDASQGADGALLVGSVHSVHWQSSAPPPGGAPSDQATPITVAVGNTSVDALTALVAAQQAAGTDLHPELLAALQLDALDLLDKPDGLDLLADKVHSSFFGVHGGGHAWTIVAADQQASPPAAAELQREAAVLAALSRAQQALDDAIRARVGLQLRLYVMWWKYVSFEDDSDMAAPRGVTASALRGALDPAVKGSLAAEVAAAMQTVLACRKAVPQGDTPEALQIAIDAYAKSHQLPPTRVLKRTAAAPFYAPSNPVLLIAGAGASGIVEAPATQCCRLGHQLVAEFEWQGHAVGPQTLDPLLPTLTLAGLSGARWSMPLLLALLREFFLLDPNNTQRLANALHATDLAALRAAIQAPTEGVLPMSIATQGWSSNPWHPLFLTWQANYYPIPYDTKVAHPKTANWRFEDGRFVWSGSQAPPPAPIALAGTLLLTPAAKFNMRARLQAQIDAGANLPASEVEALKQLRDAIEQDDGWDLLSQALDGFNEQLRLGMPGIFKTPATFEHVTTPKLSDLVGDVRPYPPGLGDIDDDAPSHFQALRAGQLVFTQVHVVDEWGQALTPITTKTYPNVDVYRSSDLTPTQNVITPSSDRFVQLGPRLLQPARLVFNLVSPEPAQQDYGPANPDVDPICGWLQPNHLDGSLLAYDAAGNTLGSLSVGVTDAGADSVCWANSPSSPYPALDELAAALPDLGGLLLGLKQRGPEVFRAFFSAIDETLWTTAPAGAAFDQSLVTLVGRPLALVRARLQLQLDGPAFEDPSWQFTFKPQQSEVESFRFAVLLGNAGRLEDGLIGYYEDREYGYFNVVQQAGAPQCDYLRPIGVDANALYAAADGSSLFVSMLVDPRAVVHATSGIVPTQTCALPPEFTTRALAALKPTFRLCGLLTDELTSKADPASAAAATTSMLTPTPSVRGGTWSWLQRENAVSNVYPVGAIDANARLQPVAPTLRQGHLQLDLSSKHT